MISTVHNAAKAASEIAALKVVEGVIVAEAPSASFPALNFGESHGALLHARYTLYVEAGFDIDRECLNSYAVSAGGWGDPEEITITDADGRVLFAALYDRDLERQEQRFDSYSDRILSALDVIDETFLSGRISWEPPAPEIDTGLSI